MKLRLAIVVVLTIATAKATQSCEYEEHSVLGFGCILENIKSDAELIDVADKLTGEELGDVTWVQFKRSKLGNVPAELYVKFVNLKTILFYECTRLKNGNGTYFDENLEGITVEKSKIISIDHKSLAELPNLKELAFINNHIKTLKKNSFASLLNLKTIVLNGNELELLDNNVFVNAKLSELSVNNNKIWAIHRNAFDDLVSLEKIDLSSNAIESLNDNTFASNSKLTSIDLSSNKLRFITTKLLSRNKMLKSMSFRSNAIIQIEESFTNGLTKLKHADFISNHCISENIDVKENLNKLSECFKNFVPMQLTRLNNRIEEIADNFEAKMAKQAAVFEAKLYEIYNKTDAVFWKVISRCTIKG